MIDVKDTSKLNEVKSDIENNIKDLIAVTDIKDSASYSVYQGEIEEGETYVGVFSGLFLFIAILSVITTMRRVVKKQRIQIPKLVAYLSLIFSYQFRNVISDILIQTL